MEVLGYILESMEENFVVIVEIMFDRILISKFYDIVYVGRLYVMVLELDSNLVVRIILVLYWYII